MISIIITSITESLLVSLVSTTEVSQLSCRPDTEKGGHASQAHFTQSCENFKDNPAIDTSLFIKVLCVLWIQVEALVWLSTALQVNKYQSKVRELT